jgi:hypothetical protein
MTRREREERMIAGLHYEDDFEASVAGVRDALEAAHKREDAIRELLTPQFVQGIPTFCWLDHARDGRVVTAYLCGSSYDRLLAILDGDEGFTTAGVVIDKHGLSL